MHGKAPAELPVPTSDIQKGCRQLATFGYTVHEGLLDRDAVHVLRARLEEQAELEREYGVAAYRDADSSERIGRPAAECGVGDAIIFDGRVWHGQGASTSAPQPYIPQLRRGDGFVPRRAREGRD